MLRSKAIERICCIVLAMTVLLTCGITAAYCTGNVTIGHAAGYETRLFDQGTVHTIDIVMDNWDEFIATATQEVYANCTMVIDGEHYKNVAIRAKGNTSLSNVASYGNQRYSFKVEFDHYQKGKSYHGLDKLSLNNIIQDATYMKDYLAYTLMGKMGVASPLCSYVQINVNGEPWGLYLAVEGVEDAFLNRNYGNAVGELYKPDSMSFGGGRGNGGGFNFDDIKENFGDMFGSSSDENTKDDQMTDIQPGTMPSDMPAGFAGTDSQMPDFGGSSGRSAGQQPNFGGSSGQQPDMSSMPAQPTGQQPDMSSMPAQSAGQQPDFGGSSGQSTGEQMPTVGAEPTADENAPTADTPTDGERNRDAMGGFGGFGMGSSDVKLQYSDDNPESYTNIFKNAKTDVTDADKARLIASLKALSEGDTSVVDTDQVMRYMVVHQFLCNDDSYTGMMVHNYYLHEQDGVLSMIPWDYNLAFGGFSGGMGGATSTVNSPIDSPVSNGNVADRPMVAWIFANDETIQEYHEAYQMFIDTVFTSGWFEDEMERVYQMIAPYVEKDTNGFYTYDQFQKAYATLKTFCEKRAESVQGQLQGVIPSTSAGQRNSDALVDASEINTSDMGSMNTGMGGQGGPDGMQGGPGELPGGGDFQPEGDFRLPEGFQRPNGAQRPSDVEAPAEKQDESTQEGTVGEKAETQTAWQRPDKLDRMPFDNAAGQSASDTKTLALAIASAVLLLIGLAFAARFKNCR